MGLKTVTPVAAEVVSLSEAKSHCRITSNDDDTYLSGLIKRARSYVEQHTGTAIGEQTLQLTLDAFPVSATGRSLPIRLDRPPLQAVNYVKYIDVNGAEQTLDSSNYYIDDTQARPWVCPAADVAWPDTQDVANAVRVEYVAGYSAALFDESTAKQFLLMLIGAMYENRELFVTGGGSEVELRFVHRFLDQLHVPRFG